MATIMTKQIIGDLDRDLAEDYNDLIKQGRFPSFEDGSRYQTVHNSGSVIKHLHLRDLENRKVAIRKTNMLIGEFVKSRGLSKIINFAKPKALVLLDVPFMEMERLPDLTHFSFLSELGQKEFQRQYGIQMQIAMENGYEPGDVNTCTNCGFDEKERKVWFYDSGDWRKVG